MNIRDYTLQVVQQRGTETVHIWKLLCLEVQQTSGRGSAPKTFTASYDTQGRI